MVDTTTGYDIGLIFAPMIADDLGPARVGVAYIQAPTHGLIDNVVEQVIPEHWHGKFVPHVYEIGRMLDDMRKSGLIGVNPTAEAEYAELGVTHMVLLEGPEAMSGDVTPFYFAGELVKHTSIVLLYCAESAKYHWMHCQQCGMSYTVWFANMQEAWGACEGLQSKARALN